VKGRGRGRVRGRGKGRGRGRYRGTDWGEPQSNQILLTRTTSPGSVDLSLSALELGPAWHPAWAAPGGAASSLATPRGSFQPVKRRRASLACSGGEGHSLAAWRGT